MNGERYRDWEPASPQNESPWIETDLEPDDKETRTVELAISEYTDLVARAQSGHVPSNVAPTSGQVESIPEIGDQEQSGVTDYSPAEHEKPREPRPDLHPSHRMNEIQSQEDLDTFKQFSLWAGLGSFSLFLALASLSFVNIFPASIFIIVGILLIAVSGIFLYLWHELPN